MGQCEKLLNITMLVALVFAIYITSKDIIKSEFTGSNQYALELNKIDTEIAQLRNNLRSNNQDIQYKLQQLYKDRAHALNNLRLSKQKTIPVSKPSSNLKRNLSANDRFKKLMEQRMRRSSTDRSGSLSTGYSDEYANILRGEGFINGEYRNERTY